MVIVGALPSTGRGPARTDYCREAVNAGSLCRRTGARGLSNGLSPCYSFENGLRGLAGAERLEGDDGVGVLDAGNDLHLLVDEVADVGVVIDVEFDQQVVIAGGGIDFRGDLSLGQRVGDGIGLTELALELDEK